MKTKRLLLFIIGLVYLVPLLAVFAPKTVYAAETATWVDSSHLTFQGHTFTDGKIDGENNGGYIFNWLEDGDTCPDRIDDITGYSDSSAKFTIRTPIKASGGCNEKSSQSITLNNPNHAAGTSFEWTDAGRISSTDGKHVFTKDPDGKFYSGAEGTCLDTIESINGNNKSATLIIRVQEDNSKIRRTGDSKAAQLSDGYFGYPFEGAIEDSGHNIPSGKSGIDCIVSKPITILIGKPENTSIEAGKGKLPAGSSEADSGEKDSCESQGGALSWLMCPVIKALDAAITWLDEQIQALLEIDKTSYDNPELYHAWSQIRNIAYIILIPIMLVMVIGTAAGSELFSAYTVKKALPRMAAAILFIALSYWICTFLIGFANVVGGGTIGILTQPFNHLVADAGIAGKTIRTAGLSDLFGGSGAPIFATILKSLVTSALAIIGVILIILFFWGPILVFIGTAFLILLLRQVLVVGLLLLAPLAILAWIFPGNDKLWKTWWGSFSKLLIMFPLIMGLIAVGRDMAWLVNNDRGGGLQGAFIAPVAKLALYILPYAFIPATFKLAGGVFATLSGMAQDKGKGLSGMFKKGRAAKFQRWQNQRAFKSAGDTGARAFVNKAIGAGLNAHKAGFNPRNWRAGVSTALEDSYEQEKKKAAEDPDVGLIAGSDDLSKAAAVGKNRAGVRAELQRQDEVRYNNAIANGASEEEALAVMRYRDPANLDKDVARVERARKKMSAPAFQQFFAQRAVAGGTANEDAADALQMVADAAGNDGTALQNAVAEMRKSAMAAGRVDIGGASFGVTYNVARDLQAGRIDAAEANRRISEDVIKSQGASVLSHPSMKPQAVRNLIPAVNARLDRAMAGGNQTEIDYELANIANIQDSLAGSSPQLADEFGQQVMGRGLVLNNRPEAVQKMFEGVGDKVEVLEAAREVHVQVKDAQGNPTGDTEVQIIPEVRRVTERGGNITVVEALNARRGSRDLMSKRREYASEQEARTRGGPPAPPGTPPGGPASTGLPPAPGT